MKMMYMSNGVPFHNHMGGGVINPYTMFGPDRVWLVLVYSGNVSVLGILFVIVSGLQEPDQMNLLHLILNTHCKVSLVI